MIELECYKGKLFKNKYYCKVYKNDVYQGKISFNESEWSSFDEFEHYMLYCPYVILERLILAEITKYKLINNDWEL